MTDLISRQAVLNAIDEISREVDDGDGFDYAKWRQYFCELPPEHVTNLAEVGTDAISRQQAIDALRDYLVGKNVPCDGTLTCRLIENEVINKLPSEQPEIIRCTECKHYREYDSEYVENAVVVQCMADRYPISEIIPDGWFCAGAERKDDE